MLLAMNQQSALPDRYAIIETSGQLRARQQALIQTLPDHIARSVSWSEHLPEQIRGIVIGNELLDAMPCDRFRICENGEVAALGVAVEADQLVWRAGEFFANGLATGMLPPDYESEVCTQAEAWVKTIGKRLSCGVLLLIDYGFSQQEFYHHDRRAGTLMWLLAVFQGAAPLAPPASCRQSYRFCLRPLPASCRQRRDRLFWTQIDRSCFDQRLFKFICA